MRILAAVSGEAPDGVRLFTVGLLCALSSAGHTVCAAFSGGVPDEISKSGVHIVGIQNGSEYRTLKALITDGDFDAVCSFDECLDRVLARLKDHTDFRFVTTAFTPSRKTVCGERTVVMSADDADRLALCRCVSYDKIDVLPADAVCFMSSPRKLFTENAVGEIFAEIAEVYLSCIGKLGFPTEFSHSDILFCGYYGYGNLGDESSLECLISAVRREIPDARLTVLASSPAEFSERFGVRAVDRMSFFSVMREIRRAGVFVFGGGGLLQDATSRRSLRYYTHVLSAASKRCRTFVYANGIGPLERRGSRQSVMRALGGVEDISVRDGLSASFLSELGLEKDRFRLGADGAFMMMPPDEASVASVGERIGLRRGEGYFAVSLRPLGGCGGDFDSRISRAVRDVSIKTGLSPVIVPMQGGEDRALCERICALSVGSAYTAPFSDADSIAALFAGAAFTVGMRLHSIIYSACVGTPVLAVSYDPKIDAACAYLGLPAPLSAFTVTSEEMLASLPGLSESVPRERIAYLRGLCEEDCRRIIGAVREERISDKEKARRHGRVGGYDDIYGYI